MKQDIGSFLACDRDRLPRQCIAGKVITVERRPQRTTNRLVDLGLTLIY